MTPRDLINLLTLGMLWGISFLFIRVAVPEFGAVALIEVRVLLAAAILVPIVLARRQWSVVARHWKPIAAMGVLHYAIPFSLFAWALLDLSAGYASLVNAAAPLFAGVVARLWTGERLEPTRLVGLVLGLGGVALLVSGKLLSAGTPDALPILATVLAAFCYGFAAVFARQRLAGVEPSAVAAGSMAAAAIVLLPLTWWLRPVAMPSPQAWGMAAVLGVFSTALAFVLYFRLIAAVGPSKAITVTFVIPVFAVACGALFIGETITPAMLAGGVVIAAGTSLATGLVKLALPGTRARGLVVRGVIIALIVTAGDDTPPDVYGPVASTPAQSTASSISVRA
jgi:drug/metabolite transporter (DMT)-like permease